MNLNDFKFVLLPFVLGLMLGIGIGVVLVSEPSVGIVEDGSRLAQVCHGSVVGGTTGGRVW